ncbi:hypothetical protein WKV52_03200 [Tetragenococcus halophilus]|uniref:hypothetical protein n=1 Tax=Tetragenococcus halophilus TaxID=51669 RepID=UPI0010318AFA
MDDSVLLSIVYGIYIDTFPQKWYQKIGNNKTRKLMSLPFYYHNLKNLENFCAKLTKQGFNSKELAVLTQNLETELDKSWEKEKFSINNGLRIVMFCLTGLAAVFSWTFLTNNVSFVQRYEYLNILSNVISFGILLGLIFMTYLANKNKNTKEKKLLSVLKDAQIIMNRSNS